MYYHYTDINGLRGILEKKVLWMTDSSFLNDTTEGTEIYEYLKKALKQINAEEEFSKVVFEKFRGLGDSIKNYTLSFSTEGDMLSQWRGYCPREGGYCIGFKDLQREGFTLRDKNKDIQRWLIGPGFCFYTEEKKIETALKIVREIFNWVKEDDPKKQYTILATQFEFAVKKMLYKSVGFQEENEVRVLAQVHSDPGVKPLFRLKSNFFIPYLELCFNMNLVSEIKIGPSNNIKLAEDGINQYINGLGSEYSHIKISKSNIPFRNF